MWDSLQKFADRNLQILDLFNQDAQRAEKFSVSLGDMLFDYSKTSIDQAARQALIDLADQAGWAERRDAMFSGEKINETENRAVLHTALRNLDGEPVFVDGQDVMPEVLQTLSRMQEFANSVRDSDITDVVNIGIGGSDLGPAMAVRALSPYQDGPRCHFVSNVDGAHISDVLRNLDAKKTLIIVASKTFTTIETMTNASTARAWILDHGAVPETQFAAVSTALDKTQAFGVSDEKVFGFADWVGGRYSLWGPIGLSLMIAIGPNAYRAFLQGAQAMDNHFRVAKGAENMPLMLALVGIWHAQICKFSSRAVLPYDERLGRLPAYLQQLEMESNGKRVQMSGACPPHGTCPLVWGEPGTNGQHAFFQLLHQGTHIVPCEFLIAAQGHEKDLQNHHNLLLANCFAQSEALMRGRSFEEARAKIADRFKGAELERQAAHRVFPGNRPSTTLIYRKLAPETLGKIIALYEHRVFVEGVILGINSFDQWGVELGKELATTLGPMLTGAVSAHQKDSSTRALIDFCMRNRG